MGGVAGGLSFEPVAWRWLIVLVVPFFLLTILHSASARAAFLRVFVGSLVFFGIGIGWLFSVGRYNPVGYAGIPVVIVYMALYPGGAAAIVYRWFRVLPPLGSYAVLCSFWIFIEWFRTIGRLAMPWTQLGHAWSTWPWAIQWADVAGEAGVTIPILVIGGALLAMARLVLWRTPAFSVLGEPKRPAAYYSAGALVIASFALLAISAMKLRAWEARLGSVPQEQEITAAALQPNIIQDYKLASYADPRPEVRAQLRQLFLEWHESLVAEQLPKEADLLVMPESTFPDPDRDYRYDTAFQERIGRLMAPFETDLLFGALRLVDAGGEYDAYNAALFVKSGESVSRALYQDKMRLVPFGEYLPYVEWIPGVRTLSGINSFNEGREVHMFETDGYQFGALICFESSFAAQARKLVREGAQFLTVITNDAWYVVPFSKVDPDQPVNYTAGPIQHHNFSRLRAVETRRPVVRAANTGVSSIIDPAGRLQVTLPLNERGIIVADIAPQSVLTFYARWGSFWVVVSALAVIVMGYLIELRTLRSKQTLGVLP